MNQWRGEPIEDKSLLVWTDQGLGDSIMLARYIPKIRAQRVVVYCDAAVFRLFRHSFPGHIEVLMKGWAFPRTDLHVPLMSLMQCFETREDNIPQGRYLHPPKKFYPTKTAIPMIGLNWQGNKRFVRDFTRSMPIAMLDPILKNATFYSLQKGNAQQDIGGRPIIDLMDECEDLCDTASLIDELDLVISTDTAVPHLAGALGKSVWLLEGFESEWRWGLGATSPWYRNVRVIRQEKAGDWPGVIERVRQELQ